MTSINLARYQVRIFHFYSQLSLIVLLVPKDKVLTYGILDKNRILGAANLGSIGDQSLVV